MGKSRSATLIIAYLLSTHPHLSPSSALHLIRQTHSLAEPNPGFMQQLQLYHSTSCATTTALDANPAYQRWLYQRTINASLAAGTAPEVASLPFADEMPSPTPNIDSTTNAEDPTNPNPNQPPPNPPTTHYRCRRCRTPLATSAYLVPHTPQPSSKSPSTSSSTSSPPSTTPCSHLHITPLSWMRPELEQGKLAGRLECPNGKCGQSVGRYAWQGMQCSCGAWVVPGMTLGRGTVDEVTVKVR